MNIVKFGYFFRILSNTVVAGESATSPIGVTKCIHIYAYISIYTDHYTH